MRRTTGQGTCSANMAAAYAPNPKKAALASEM
jgi:hypothetical protein